MADTQSVMAPGLSMTVVLDPPAIKPLKRRRTNVRTGCKTCKVRRVKCDETKPFCQRCTKFGRQCDGYEANVKSPGTETIVPKALIPAHTTRAIILPTPRRHAFGSEQEHAYFRVFCERTCINLAGDFDKALWNRIVLQAAEDEPSLRHALIALGALDKTLDATAMAKSTHGPVRFEGNVHHSFALQQYGKSVKRMREMLATGSIDMRKTLIGCLLAVCFESFHGNSHAAMAQARSGVKLLNEWIPSIVPKSSELLVDHSPIPTPSTEIEDELILAFNRLDINSNSFVYGHPVHLSPATVKNSIRALQNIPAIFPSFEAARQCMELLMRTCIHWSTFNYIRPEQGDDEPVWNTTEDVPWVTTLMWTDYQRTVKFWDQFMLMHLRWWRAAKPLFEFARTPQGTKELSTAISIELRFRTTYLALSNIHGASEKHEAFLLDPGQILMLAESLNARRRASRHADDSRFVFDGPFIGALHVVNQKTRDPAIRRRAIAMLEGSNRREGLWDSRMVAKLATLTLKIEEEGKDMNGEIPEHSRIQASRTAFDLQRKRGALQYRRRNKAGLPGYNYGAMEFTW